MRAIPPRRGRRPTAEGRRLAIGVRPAPILEGGPSTTLIAGSESSVATSNSSYITLFFLRLTRRSAHFGFDHGVAQRAPGKACYDGKRPGRAQLVKDLDLHAGGRSALSNLGLAASP